jgi:hypothetical protein
MRSPHQDRPDRSGLSIFYLQGKADQPVSARGNGTKIEPLQDQNIVFQQDIVNGEGFILISIH